MTPQRVFLQLADPRDRECVAFTDDGLRQGGRRCTGRPQYPPLSTPWTPALRGQAGLLSSTWDPARDESSTSTVGRSPVVVLPTTVQPVEPSAINTARVKFGPENVF